MEPDEEADNVASDMLDINQAYIVEGSTYAHLKKKRHFVKKNRSGALEADEGTIDEHLLVLSPKFAQAEEGEARKQTAICHVNCAAKYLQPGPGLDAASIFSLNKGGHSAQRSNSLYITR